MFLDIDGNRVFTLSFGAGPRTLLAHGGWISNVEDWLPTLGPLSARWRTVTYDHRGAGLTRVPVERISTEALVDDVFRVMDATGIERCTPEPDSEHIRRWGESILARATPEAAERLFMIEAEQPLDWAAVLPQLRLPTLMVHGELDAFYATGHMRYTASLFPDCELVEMAGSGHLPAMTRPLEVAAHIERFFARRGV